MKSLLQNSDNSLTFDIIRVWPAKCNECKFFLVFYLNKMDFEIVVDNSSVPFAIFFFFWSSSAAFHFSQEFLQSSRFSLELENLLYCFKDIPNFRILRHNCLFSRWIENSFFFRASSILLTQLSISECKKLIFHAEHSRGCIGYTTPRTIPNMTCASLV